MSPSTANSFSGAPLPSDRARWIELLDALDPDELVERFTFLLKDIPDYDPPPMPLAELRSTGRATFVTLIELMKPGVHPTRSLGAAELGAVRARAGLPLTALMTAIRLDFTVFWEALTRIASEGDAELIVRHTPTILETVDDYVLQTQRAYAAELERIQSEATSVLQGHIAGLFQGSQPTGERLTAIAEGLGVPIDADFTVAAAVGDDIPHLRVFTSDAHRAGITIFTYHFEDTLIAFFRPAQVTPVRASEFDAQLRGLRIGVLTVGGGLLEVRDAANTARELAHLIGPTETGAISWREGWARVARQQLLDANHPVLSDVQSALATCGAAEQARLTEAVSSYLQTGSIGESAAQLYCHRNTLTNRLRRFAEITGVDPLVPEEAARLVVGWA